jgi:ubiquinone/menaquinone biosynthesis C-methylase UbiE
MSFDLVAPHYRWMEPLLAGRKLQRSRTAHLRHLSAPHSVLILGEGPGQFLAAFRQKFPSAEITCVDSSQRMLAIAQNRLRSLNLQPAKTTFLHADALEYSPPSDVFDLIVTHFFLDCFRPDQLQQLIPKLARAGTPNASWLLSDFTIPPKGFPRLRARAIHRLMYTFFRAATKLPARALTLPDPFLRASGFTLRHRLTTNLSLIHSDLWSREGGVALNCR